MIIMIKYKIYLKGSGGGKKDNKDYNRKKKWEKTKKLVASGGIEKTWANTKY